MTKIAVISDIHGNADSLRLVLKQLKEKQVDLTVCLGDLLTYGTSPIEVIDLLLNYAEKNRLIMIKGNHDQFYFDILSGDFKHYSMPEFVLESIYWSAEKIASIKYESLFDWKESYSYQNIYFAHANPFKYGDWRYVEKQELVEEAFLTLLDKNFYCGIFGHSHRQLMLKRDDKLTDFSLDVSNLSFNNQQAVIINSGSIGQPRGRGYCYCLLDLKKEDINAKFISFQPDVEKLIRDLHSTDMSYDTKLKLCDYLRS